MHIAKTHTLFWRYKKKKQKKNISLCRLDCQYFYTNNTVSTIKLTTTTFEIFTPIDALSNISLQPSDEHVLHSAVFTYDVSLYADRH